MESTVHQVALLVLTYITFLIIKRKILAAPAHGVAGPELPSFIWGSLKEAFNESPRDIFSEWTKTYGFTFSYYGMFGESILLSADPVAVKHIITRTEIYQRSPLTKNSVGRALGDSSLFMVEDDKHRKQRKVMTPAFFPARIRQLNNTFLDKGAQLRDLWLAQVEEQNGMAQLDVNPWLGRLTLDIIALAGFDADLNTLDPQSKGTDLGDAIRILLDLGAAIDPMTLLRASFAIFRIIPSSSDRKIKAARVIVTRVASELIDSSRALIAQETNECKTINNKKDLLSLLVRESLSNTDVHERMSDEDIQSQVPTFLLAGHDSTGATLDWLLFVLSTNIDVQNNLRIELSSLNTDRPTMDQLNELPYLDSVIRETLRLYPIATTFPKVAVADDIIPLGTPVVGRNGKLMHEIHIREGQTIHLPVGLFHKERKFWGEDAEEFRPERWGSLPDTVTQLPGVWSNLLSFFGGPRSCIGFRFALTELKAVIFTLVRTLDFELAVPVESITASSVAAIRKPMYNDGESVTTQLPLRIRRV